MLDRPGDVLGPVVAGSWYPADRDALAREVDGFLAGADASGLAPASALIAPHAGFVYSGAVAAHGFHRFESRGVERVLLIGPSHYAAFEGAVVPTASSYRTPLGDVPIDTDCVNELRRQAGFRADDAPFAREHCLEAEIPFLQRRLAEKWRVVPVLVGMPGARGAIELADALRPWMGPATIVVVSSDFTHYGPRFGYVPFTEDVADGIRQLDTGAIERIIARDASGFDRYVRETGATICGRNPIQVLLHLLPEDWKASLAAYDTSGQITGDWEHSVSYASVSFHGVAS